MKTHLSGLRKFCHGYAVAQRLLSTETGESTCCTARAKTCEAMKGLIKEASSMMEEKADSDVMDAYYRLSKKDKASPIGDASS